MTHELVDALRRALASGRKALGPAAAAPGELDAGDDDEEGDDDATTPSGGAEPAAAATPSAT